jgi:hypothetical protein
VRFTGRLPEGLPTQPDFYKAPYAIPTVVNGKAYVPTYALYDSTNGSYDKSGIQVYACSTSNCSGS